MKTKAYIPLINKPHTSQYVSMYFKVYKLLFKISFPVENFLGQPGRLIWHGFLLEFPLCF